MENQTKKYHLSSFPGAYLEDYRDERFLSCRFGGRSFVSVTPQVLNSEVSLLYTQKTIGDRTAADVLRKKRLNWIKSSPF